MTSLTSAVRACLVCPAHSLAPGVRTAEFVFPAGFLGFQGHFPGNPIVPGVAQIMAVLLTAQSETGPLRLREVVRSKFVRMIRPGERLRVHTTSQTTAEGLRLAAECATDEGLCAQFKLKLEQA